MNGTENRESWYSRFRSFAMNRMMSSRLMEEESLIYWRVRILFSILFASSLFSLATLVPVFILVSKNKLWGLGIFDLAAWVIVIILMLARNIRFEIRSAITLILTYLLGLIIILSVGILSGGPLFLFTFAVFTGIFRGTRAVFWALAMNAVTLTIISWLVSAGLLGRNFPFFKTTEAMMAAFATFMLLNVAVAISVRVLVKGLSKTNQQQKELLINLKNEQLRLEKTKVMLELEIEQHKRVEAALNDRERTLETLISNLPGFVYRCANDRDWTMEFISDGCLEMTGYEPHEFMGNKLLSYNDIVHPDFREPLWGKWQDSLKERTTFEGEYQIINRDGEIRWVWERGIGIYSANDELLFLEGFITDITERKRAEEELDGSFKRLRAALGGTIQALAVAVETRDPYTAGHQKSVADLSRAIATEMGLDNNRTDGIRMAGVIHDLGKMGIPAEILSKPSKLSEIEYNLIKTHPRAGYDILKGVEFPWPIADIILQHHERYNGSGYPAGLKGDEILLEARIIAVADVVEAIASYRPYRPAQGIEKAIEEITRNRGILYDPAAVDACLCLVREKGYKF